MENRQRRKTVNQRRQENTSKAAFYFIIVFQFLVICALGFALKVNSNKLKSFTDAEKVEVTTEPEVDMSKSMDSMSRIYTNDGTPIDLYVIPDPDRGTEFVVSSRGGVCVRP